MTRDERAANARERSIIAAMVDRVGRAASVLEWSRPPDSVGQTVTSWTHSSIVVERFEATSGAVSGIVTRSRAAGAARALVASTRTSGIYRWLTAEPEPEVIVIDLRETRLAGPVLRAVDVALETFLERTTGSRLVASGRRSIAYAEDAPIRALSLVALSALLTSLAASVATGAATATGVQVRLFLAALAVLGLRSETSLADLRESRAGRYLVALLEPPAPRDQRSDPSDGRDVGDSPGCERDEGS